MPAIRVVEPGFQTTVQDLGRPGCAHMGVSPSGAADTLSLRLGNLLVGNPENSASLEMTLTGGVFEFEGDCLIALTGSDFASRLDGMPVPNWVPVAVKSHQVLHCGNTRAGARCYLSVHGGIDEPLVLGSASTHLLAGMGGHEGRALRAGDVLRVAAPTVPSRHVKQVHPQKALRWLATDVIRITPGPQSHWFSPESVERFLEAPAMVLEDFSRAAIPLAARRIEQLRREELLIEGVSCGALQMPPSGRPVILFVERQTTGNFPKLANVITADLPRVGQLKPFDRFRFQLVSFDESQEILRQQEEWIDSLE